MKRILQTLLDISRAIVDGLHGGYLSKIDRRARRLEAAVDKLIKHTNEAHDARQQQILLDFLRDLKS